VGGGDRKVHVWDARGRQYIKGFPGHKDAVSALAFREGTHELYSASLDRSVKLWSLDDLAYVDTLFGHQAGEWRQGRLGVAGWGESGGWEAGWLGGVIGGAAGWLGGWVG
jgi:WD40 repeat protein